MIKWTLINYFNFNFWTIIPTIKRLTNTILFFTGCYWNSFKESWRFSRRYITSDGCWGI